MAIPDVNDPDLQRDRDNEDRLSHGDYFNEPQDHIDEDRSALPDMETSFGEAYSGNPDVPAAQDEAAPAPEAETLSPAAADGAAAVAPVGTATVVPDRPGMSWFIIHTYSGFEQKVADSLRSRAGAFGFAEQIGDVMIPTEEVVENRNGKKVTSKRMLYPGYVMVQMAMDDQLWHYVKDTPRVTGFVGGGNTPVPLSTEEVNAILNRQTTAAERPRPKVNYEKGETVRIVDGPFANFSGKVDEINMERSTLRVMVTIFGRATPVELEFLQVEKS